MQEAILSETPWGIISEITILPLYLVIMTKQIDYKLAAVLLTHICKHSAMRLNQWLTMELM